MTLLPRTDRDQGQTQNRFDCVGKALRFGGQAAFVSIRAVELAQLAQLRQAASQVYFNRERGAHSAPKRSGVEWRTTALCYTPCVAASRM